MGSQALILPLLFCFLLSSPSYAKPYHEAIQLLSFINSPRSLRAMRNVRWSLLSAKNGRQASVYVGPQDGLMAADKIDALPGQPEGVNFDQYAGYVTVDSAKGRALFYYFVEAPQDSGSKPLVLWLNGGPGCSSIGAGAMEELGPFRVNSDGKTLTANEAAWNNGVKTAPNQNVVNMKVVDLDKIYNFYLANVIFLESPAGVGFSYSNTSSDYETTGDSSTAADSYTFLVNWLERFPQYKSRDFFITGESYAGHYIPELASLILQKNAAETNAVIPLKGIAMGNAFVDVNTNWRATFDYLWTHALIADETHKTIQSSCNFSSSSQTGDCDLAIHRAFYEVGPINPYNIYAPLCRDPLDTKASARPDPCAGGYINSYMNAAEVQKAFHVNGPLPYPWSACSEIDWYDAPDTMIPAIRELVGAGLRVWFYSGDQDAVVPVTSTRYSVNMLRLPVESQWEAWTCGNEVGGYVVGYKGLTLATVRGAGHLVPSYQPERSLTLFSAFLKGTF